MTGEPIGYEMEMVIIRCGCGDTTVRHTAESPCPKGIREVVQPPSRVVVEIDGP